MAVLDLFSLEGKIAIVTGGGRGIGLEIVRSFAQAGADVAIIYRTTKEAHQQASQISKDHGVRVEAFQSDVRCRNTIAQTIDRIAAMFGRLDIVVANAGVCANISSLEYTEEQWQSNNSVNYDGAMWTAQAAGKIFKKQGYGNLIITASVSSILCNIPQTQAAYNSSKAAAAHLTRCLAVEWVEFARVNCVSPGYVNTLSKLAIWTYGFLSVTQRSNKFMLVVSSQGPELMEKWLQQVPARRVAQPSEIAAVYIFLASDACPYMTGAELFADGAYSLV